jgi:hypothetical protein
MPVRRVLKNCFFANTQNEIIFRTGSIPNHAFMCQVFNDSVYTAVPPEMWRETGYFELDNVWSWQGGDMTQTFPILVPYELDFEFEPMPPTGNGNVQAQELNFIRDTSGAMRIVSAQDNRRGTRKSQHVLLRG